MSAKDIAGIFDKRQENRYDSTKSVSPKNVTESVHIQNIL